MSPVDILIAVGKGSIAVISGIGKGSLGKIGANIVGDKFAKFDSYKSADDLENENRYYCPWCGTGIEYGRAICTGSGCGAEIIYEATQKELKEAVDSGLKFGFYILLLLFAFIY